MSNLTLNVKKKWFDMILSGEKKEEYREIKSLYIKKFEDEKKIYPSRRALINILTTGNNYDRFKNYKTVTFLNGMKTKTPKIVIECKGIEIGKAVPEWSDNWQGEVFVIKLGNIIETNNL